MNFKTIKLNEVELNIIKTALELLLTESNEELPCESCQKYLMKLVNMFTKITKTTELNKKIKLLKIN